MHMKTTYHMPRHAHEDHIIITCQGQEDMHVHMETTYHMPRHAHEDHIIITCQGQEDMHVHMETTYHMPRHAHGDLVYTCQGFRIKYIARWLGYHCMGQNTPTLNKTTPILYCYNHTGAEALHKIKSNLRKVSVTKINNY